MLNKKLVFWFGFCIHTVSYLRRYCNDVSKFLAFETPYEAHILMFGVSNAKYLAFNTSDENALRV